MLRQFPLHIHVSTLFLILIVTVGGLMLGVGYFTSRNLINQMADDMASRVGRETNSELQRILRPVDTVVNVLALDEMARLRSHDQRMDRLPLIRNLLDRHPVLSAVYIGYGNGDFFYVRHLQSDEARLRFKAPDNARYVVQSIDRASARGRYLYLDPGLRPLRVDERPDYVRSYDPRQRDWYKQAQASPQTVLSNPYLFFSDRQVGITMAVATGQRGVVVGADIELQTLNSSLSQQKVTPRSQLALVNTEGRMFAHEDTFRLIYLPRNEERPTLATLDTFGEPILQQVQRETDFNSMPAQGWIRKTVQADGDAWKVSLHKLEVQGAENLLLLIAVPQSELLAVAYAQTRTAAFITLLIVLGAMPITWWVARTISRPLVTLTREADSIRHFNFTHPLALRSHVLEVNQLSDTIAKMKHTIRQFLELSDAIAAEKNFDRLLPRLLGETVLAAEASSGLLYLWESQRLEPIAGRTPGGLVLQDNELKRLHSIPSERANPPGPPTFSEAAAGPLLAHALRTGQVQQGALTAQDVAALGLVDAIYHGGPMQAMAVPLTNRRQELVGAMVLLSSAPMDNALLAFIAAFSGTAAVSLEAQAMLKEQKALFEAFIRLVANAIDTKSAYTGGHCARVPELVKMLAQAACDIHTGPYQHFQLNDDEWETLRIAAWLHDCGKVTTPEYVVDKATKLETLYNRIHEIRTRFEVLKRDAHLQHLERLLAGQPADKSMRQLEADWRVLDDDFAFVAQCNVGGEELSPSMQKRLWQIGQRTWTRTLDNRLGLSHEEATRLAQVPPTPLPAVEHLLADRPEDRLERTPRDRIDADNPWGFRMDCPDLLYNRGELYNLSVEHGTLTDEERYKINDHIVQTEIMLSGLPFPRHLQRVLPIAAGHHEKLDGTGYPKGLHAEQLSTEARMLAIADIFEALTARDRPYKKGLKLSQAVAIMARMRDDRHIDADLFDIFLRSGVYRQYAEQHMAADQIDEVDVNRFLQHAEGVA